MMPRGAPLPCTLLLAAALLSGCASLPGAPDSGREVATLLANHERLATARAEEQRSELQAAQGAHDRAPNDATRLRLALAMLLPRIAHGPNDDARLQGLLAAVEAAPSTPRSARHDLAQLLLRLVNERQHEQRRLEQTAQQLREERQKSEDMQQKIESLRAIDREMRARRKEP